MVATGCSPWSIPRHSDRLLKLRLSSSNDGFMKPCLPRFALPALAALIAMLSAFALARAAGWPARPIHLIVPGGPGGVVDLRARWIAERLAPALGQPIVVENRAGAGGNIGTEAGAHSAPDGYTLVMVHQGTLVMNPHLYRHPGYDALHDLAPITRIGVGPLLLAVNPSIPVSSVAELIALAKAKPGQLSFGSPGVGTPPHMAAELFKRAAGIDIVLVPYRGGGQTVSDLMAGHIAASIEGMNVQLPQVKAGHLRALAVTSAQRVPSLPDVPTIAEAGLPGYEYMGWVGIAAPAGTPSEVTGRLYREIARILQTQEARDWFDSYGQSPGGESPEAFGTLIRAEYAKWGTLIRDAGLKAD